MQSEASAQDGGSEERGAAIGLVSSRECKPAKSVNKLEFDGAISPGTSIVGTENREVDE